MHGVGADGVGRPAQLDARQLAGRSDERLERENQARGDGATDVRALGAHQVEVRAGAQVDHDRRTAELDLRRQRIGEPIRAGLGGAVDLDLQDPLQAAGVNDERCLAGFRADHAREGRGQGRDHARHRYRIDFAQRVPVEAQ